MKVTVNRELIDKLVNTPPQKGKYYYLEIDNYEFFDGVIHSKLRFELEDTDLRFYDEDDLMAELMVGETVELDFNTTEQINENLTETYFGE